MSTMTAAAALVAFAKNNRLSTDANRAILSGQQIARDKVYFARKAAAAVSSVDLVDPTTEDATGESNLNKGELPSGRYLVCDRISIASITNASVTAGVYSTVLPAAIRNGEVRIEQDGKILYEGPISEFHSEAVTQDKDQKYKKLDNPILLQPNKPLHVRMDFPDATAVDTNVEIAFAGVENQPR